MDHLSQAIVYVALLGLLSNYIARLIPRRFDYTRWPFRPYAFEKNGKAYEKIGVRWWKNKVPDVSKVLKFLPKKQLSVHADAAQAELLVQESCVAEVVHWGLLALSQAIFLFWRSIGAFFFLFLYNVLGNLLYIVIQRYNRPRLVRLAAKKRLSGGV